jgi:hypothetical protein
MRTSGPIVSARHVSTVAALILVAAPLLMPSSRVDSAPPTAQRARAAEEFVDSIGVNVHLHYNDTVYNRYTDVIRPRLVELGVRHVRDGAYTYKGASAGTFYYQRLRDLGRLGIQSNLITAIDTPFSQRTDVDKLDDIQAWTGGAVETFEGANEPDINGGGDWAKKTRDLQGDLWRKVREDPELRRVGVIAPSPAFKPAALGDISAWTDFGNWHPYAGGNCPTCPDVYGQSYDTRVGRYRSPTADDPMVASETGYHNATTGQQDHPGVSERAAGKYIPRLLLEHFNREVVRTYLYELIDLRNDPDRRRRDVNFGLLRNDGSPKPAFVATRNLIGLLTDPGPAFTPSSLRFELAGETDKVHTTLLQKRDGAFWLALWQERRSYDTGQRANQPDALAARGDIDVPTQRVTVTTDDIMAQARLYRPGDDTRPQRDWTATRSFTIDVPDDVMLLELQPSIPEHADPTPLTPPPADTPPTIDVGGACGGVARGVFTDVPASHTFAEEIDCVYAWRLAQGTGSGHRYAPDRPVLRWQMAVFIERLAALDSDHNGATTPARYGDIATLSSEARDAIAHLTRLGVVNGTTGTTFAPFDRVTRAQLAAFLNRLRTVDGDTSSVDTDYFTDDDGSVHEQHINAVAGMGLVNGVGDRRYCPNAPVDRGQMAAMLSRFVQTRVDAGQLDVGQRR